MNGKSKKTAKRDGTKKKAGKRDGEKASGMASERPRGLRAVKVNDMSLEEWWSNRDEFIEEAERRAGPAKVAADKPMGAESNASIETPKGNRRFWGPRDKTLSMLLEGGKRLSFADRRTFDHLMRLVIDIQIFFGQDRQAAAHFLFLVWMDCFRSGSVWDVRRASSDLEEELKQFGCDVAEAIKPKKKPGRKRKPSVTAAKELKAQGFNIRQICERVIPDWHSHPDWMQQRIIRGLDDAVRKREKADQGEKTDAEK